MKLNSNLKRQLLASVPSSAAAENNLLALVDDACELLTGQIVLWLKGKQKALQEQRNALPQTTENVDVHRVLSGQIGLLGRVLVELAETS